MEDEKKCDIDLNIFDFQGLGEIRNRPDSLAKIKLDVTPRMMMEPRFQQNPEDVKKLQDISGYMFYIESQCEPPALMLMRVGRRDVTVTLGRIDETPQELVKRAIETPVEEPTNGMYAITQEIKEWLKKELGL